MACPKIENSKIAKNQNFAKNETYVIHYNFLYMPTDFQPDLTKIVARNAKFRTIIDFQNFQECSKMTDRTCMKMTSDAWKCHISEHFMMFCKKNDKKMIFGTKTRGVTNLSPPPLRRCQKARPLQGQPQPIFFLRKCTWKMLN